MRIATFTGPHTAVPERAYDLITEVVSGDDADLFVTGGAHYVDSMAAQFALGLHPDKKHKLVVPNGKHNEPLVYYFCILQSEGLPVEVELMPPGTTHIHRDERMIEIALGGDVGSHLNAFPMTPKEQIRSGTWTTIRHARSAGLPIYFYPLNGDAWWTENES